MTCYSLQQRDWIFVKGYEFLPFAKDIITNIGKNISKEKLPQKERFTKQKKKLVI